MIFPARPSRSVCAETLSHGQKQWLEIGMLLIQDPELLMLDEPVAGMSVSERTKTAELLKQIIKNRSVIVIEHDMKFVEEHRASGDGAAPGQGAGRRRHAVGAIQSESEGSLSWSLRTRERCSRFAISRRLRAERGSSRHRSRGHAGRNRRARRGGNGMGKSTLMKSLIGVMPARSGQIVVDGTDVTALAHPSARCPRPRLRPAGPADLRHDDGQGEHRDRPRRDRQARNSARDFRSLSDPRGFRAPARRQPLGRPAAAARHRAGAGERSEGPAAGRADRGHPAIDHQGYRAAAARHPQHPQSLHRRLRASAELRARHRRPHPRHGGRHGSCTPTAASMSTKRRSPVSWRSDRAFTSNGEKPCIKQWARAVQPRRRP